MIAYEPGSFKDPSGRVFYLRDEVYRTLTPEAGEALGRAWESGLMPELTRAGLVLETERVRAAEVEVPGLEGTAQLLRQPRVPVVSYAYEWSFEMLRDAALVTLEILERCLAAGFLLKDANSFNLLFLAGKPRLVDVPSIEPYQEGMLWAGYGQFCRSFLFPLLLGAHLGLEFQPLLRGTMGELPVREVARLFRLRDWFKPGVLRDVVLQARLERDFARRQETLAGSVSNYRLPKELLVANVRRLRRIIERLRTPNTPSEWSGYTAFHNYTDEDQRQKRVFVERALEEAKPARVLDLGCNTGQYTELARARGAQVVAVDVDAQAIDLLYRGLPAGASVWPMVANLANPTPAMGWALKERRSLLDRLGSDFVLALALVHHLRITAGVPLEQVVEQLFALAPEGVVEWVDKQDSMVRRMLSLRPDVYPDYTWENFRALLERHGTLVSVQETHEGRRRLCHVRRR
ncbi:hypothetical protein BO221_00800 [Archangium sp. Cb G35]|uniref:class I SAM-dependent methyltransferase n=1 Tax=Archangium sp. Cb G35 TaxID=1920190 RepID=UPI00093731F0|nr:class I SAM-dependent methyltransferase [Archangium sp. Cb G35]OJT26615.1 hypothetical protein BO221_00800 [Archangium sp. Cb G35]